MACEATCMGEGEGHSHIIVCRPNVDEYVVRVRFRGDRKYMIQARTDSCAYAYRRLAEEMATGKYKRGDILACETLSYYEPMRLIEMVRPW